MRHARSGGLLVLCLVTGHLQAANCTLNVTGIDFGAVTQLNPQPVDVQGTVTVQCVGELDDLDGLPPAATVDYQITMGGGTAGTAVARAMQGPGGALGYNLYTDPGRQFIWGDGNNGTSIQAGQFVYSELEVLGGTQKSAEHLSYARIPPGINVAPGPYTDMVTVTLVF